LRNVIRGRDALVRIKNWHQDRECLESEQREEKGLRLLWSLLRPTSLTAFSRRGGGRNAGGVKAFSHDLKRVCWPLNFKPCGLRCISSPSRPPVGTPMSWQTICQSVCPHPPGPGSLGFPRGQLVPRMTYADCSPVTSVPRVHVRESIET
jgi:hypothetical protein